MSLLRRMILALAVLLVGCDTTTAPEYDPEATVSFTSTEAPDVLVKKRPVSSPHEEDLCETRYHSKEKKATPFSPIPPEGSAMLYLIRKGGSGRLHFHKKDHRPVGIVDEVRVVAWVDGGEVKTRTPCLNIPPPPPTG